MTQSTIPTNQYEEQDAPHLTLAPSVKTDDGREFVHKDYIQVTEAWEVEAHVAPPRVYEHFGDVESWAHYVTAYGLKPTTLLTWNDSGLFAVLDYHIDENTPGRCQWRAEHRFTFTPQWTAWASLADGRPRSQVQLVEALEDLAEDIVQPDAAQLMGILRTLRAMSSAKAETTLRQDGTSKVVWSNDSELKGEAEIPADIRIQIPVLKGHMVTDEQGLSRRVLYPITVRLRCSVGKDAAIAFRLSMPNAERLLEDIYADRVQAAKDALGDGYTLLRAA